ncbi:MAG: APC family permease [Candidatus Eremiobacteraeota bacterium]|nr:APC family permease [Candidatus Eremiobacteraeota bacterium]
MTGEPVLRRSLGLADVTFFFIIAASNLQWVAAAAVTGPSSLIIWVLGWACMFLPLSIVVVFLSSRHPDEGGLYVWSKRAFGPFAGFISGWTYWTSNLPYFPALLYFMAGNLLFVHGGRANPLSGSAPYFIGVSLAGLGLATLLNVLGLDIEKWLNNIGAGSRWAVTLALIALGAFAWHKFGMATPVNAATVRPGLDVTNLVFWLTIAFAWTGPEAISFMAGEVKQARHTIGYGLALAAPVIAVIYIGGTAAVLAILPPSQTNPIYGVMQSVGTAAGRFGWDFITPIAAVLVMVSCLASCGAWLGAVARLPFVAGLDAYLPKGFGRMHPRWGSPVAALVTQAGIAACFIFLGQGGTSVRGAYDVLVSTTVISTLIPFLLLFAAAIPLSSGPVQPEDLRPIGGRFTILSAATVGFLTTLIAVILALIPPANEPDKTLAVVKIIGLTVLMIGSGAVLYVAGARHKRKVDAAEAAAEATV